MRLIDADEAIRKIASITRLARSDQQKALLGRYIYIVEHCPTISGSNENTTIGGNKGEAV